MVVIFSLSEEFHDWQCVLRLKSIVILMYCLVVSLLGVVHHFLLSTTIQYYVMSQFFSCQNSSVVTIFSLLCYFSQGVNLQVLLQGSISIVKSDCQVWTCFQFSSTIVSQVSSPISCWCFILMREFGFRQRLMLYYSSTSVSRLVLNLFVSHFPYLVAAP